MQRNRWAVFWLWVIVWLLALDQVSFAGKVYEWIDDFGNVGFTDDPANIPVKYRKTAIEEELEAPPLTQVRVSPEMPPPSQAPDTDDAGHDRTYWQGRVKVLRDRRADLQERKVEIVQDLETLNGRVENGIDTIKYLELRRQYLQELAKTKDDIKEIDRQLNDVLPEEARKANAPPGWLR